MGCGGDKCFRSLLTPLFRLTPFRRFLYVLVAIAQPTSAQCVPLRSAVNSSTIILTIVSDYVQTPLIQGWACYGTITRK